jgi:hypothetical protein
MNVSTVITEELKGLNSRKLESVYRFIKSLKTKKQKQQEEVISLAEIWQITAKTPGNWSREIQEMREDRL